jgi:hypothetical protein
MSRPKPIAAAATATAMISNENICPWGYPHDSEKAVDKKLKL